MPCGDLNHTPTAAPNQGEKRKKRIIFSLCIMIMSTGLCLLRQAERSRQGRRIPGISGISCCLAFAAPQHLVDSGKDYVHLQADYKE